MIKTLDTLEILILAGINLVVALGMMVVGAFMIILSILLPFLFLGFIFRLVF